MVLVVLLAWAVIAQLNSRSLAVTEPSSSPGASPQQTMSPSPTRAPNMVLGDRTKTVGCVIQGALQDASCTPGAVLPATKAQICTPGYAKSVRDVPESEKTAVYAEYGITTHATGQYEVDHLISLELGGSNDISNLWPEAASPTPGFHQKDVVENALHDEVCSGQISLQLAQLEIATNWLTLESAGSPHPAR